MTTQEAALNYRELVFDFNENPEKYGPIEDPTKLGLLLIARNGAKTWEIWQNKNLPQIIDLSGIDDFYFSDIDFSEFQFRSKIVDFNGSKFSKIRFNNCRFHGSTNFKDCIFSENCEFNGSIFDGGAFFDRSTIASASFDRCNFMHYASFEECKFHNNASFSKANFELESHFRRAEFLGGATFKECVFDMQAFFVRCDFRGPVNFFDSIFSHADFSHAQFRNQCILDCTPGSQKEKSYSLTFCGSKFHGDAWFRNRIFGGSTDFGAAKSNGKEKLAFTTFKKAPIFHGAKLHQDTNFDKTEFDTPKTLESARAFRTLKLAMEQLKATREEQRFFRLEMKSERPSLPHARQALSLLYEWCSDYGFSLWRPLAALLIISLLIGGTHGILANICAERPQCVASAGPGDSSKRTSDLIKYVLVNLAPVPGLDKMQTELRKPLFGEHGPIAVAAIILEILHKIVALVMTFLFALGLRNLFKMKS